MSEHETPTTAFVLSLFAGILILISGLMYLVMGTAFSTRMMDWYYQGMGGMMVGTYGIMMGGFPESVGFVASMIMFLAAIGIICGIIILIGAAKINSNPQSGGIWGIVILVLSFVSMFEGGGFLIGAILGIVGGILAATWKPITTAPEEKKPE